MGIADSLVLDGAQTKSLVGIVGRLLEPAVVEDRALGLGIFKIKLAVVGAFEAVGEVPSRIPAVEPGALEKRHGR